MVSSTKSLLLGVALIALGFVALPSATATVYTNGGALPGILELMVFSCFAILLIGTVLTSSGVLNLIDSLSKGREERSTSSWLAKLQFITRDRSSRTLRSVSGITYGILLSSLSGILVFQPAQSFSALYNVAIPSTTVAVCCGSIGQMPQQVVYLSNSVGIVLTPLGLVLLLTVSWLVGINANAAVLAFRTRTVRGNGTLLTTAGSFLGIFSVCPSCAQGLLATTLGGSGIAFVTLLASYQGYFIAASVPMLVISLLWTAKSLSRISDLNCELPNERLPQRS